MFSLYDECVMMPFDADVRSKCTPFTCGNDDLDEFFSQDADSYAEELLGKTYCWVTQEQPYRIVCIFTLANDSIKTHALLPSEKNRLQRHITNPKRGRSYPATLIGRLGVNILFQGKEYQIGSQLMSFIRDWFRDADNKTGCRFLVVDAYNDSATLRYYIDRNNFRPLHKTEQDEKAFYDIPPEEPLLTRLLYLDLKR